MPNTNHYPWCDGSLRALGALTGQKTMKALCGARPAFIDCDHTRHTDCPDCRHLLRNKIEDNKELIALSAEYSSPAQIADFNSAIARMETCLKS